MGTSTSDLDLAADEVSEAVRSVSAHTLDAVAAEIALARVIACFAEGREGLVLKGLTMRLFQAGLDAHAVGETTCPAVGAGDLVILSRGPGNASMVEALAGVAKKSGARLLCFTAEPNLSPAQLADMVVVIDADPDSTLPTGSGYDLALFVFVNLVTNRVRATRNESAEVLRARQTNLV